MTTVFQSHKSEVLLSFYYYIYVFSPGIYRFKIKQTLETLIILPTHMRDYLVSIVIQTYFLRFVKTIKIKKQF